MPVAYDSRSYALAEYFLSDLPATDADIHALAQAIQRECEDAWNEIDARAQTAPLSTGDSVQTEQKP